MNVFGRRANVPLVAIAVALAAGVPAFAYVCHPDIAGTRTLAVHGRITGYSLLRNAVGVAYRDRAGCARVMRWKPLRGASLEDVGALTRRCTTAGAPIALRGSATIVRDRPASTLIASDGTRRAVLRSGGAIEIYRHGILVRSIARAGTAKAQALALSRDRVVVLARGSASPDLPPTLEVYRVSNSSLAHVWPLLVRPVTLDLEGGVAVFAAAQNGGAFGLRLSDGLTTFFGPTRRGDTPQIGPGGLVFQSGMYKKLQRQGVALLKFVPTASMRLGFARTFHTLATRQPIEDFSMDGQRVAVLIAAPAGQCKQVRLWSIPWHYFGRIDMNEDLTCAAGMDIHRVSLAGIRMEWMATKDGVTRIVMTDSDKCMEEFVGRVRSTRETLLAGDRGLLAFAAPRSQSSAREPGLLALRGSVRALSADSRRLAVLRSDGRVDLLGLNGTRYRTIRTRAATAIALRRDRLVVLTRAGTVEVWNTVSAKREHAWPAPRGVDPRIDVHYGIAVLSAGNRVYALRLDSGRLALLARAPIGVRAQIEEPGVVYQYNTRRGGFMRFIPLATVERALA